MKPTVPFWRSEPLSEKEERLLDAVLSAHDRSASRNNVSSVNVLNTTHGTGDYCKSIATGLLSIGGLHGPLEQTINYILNPDLGCLVKGKVPGWGNSFVKNGPDPIWSEVDSILFQDWPDLFYKLAHITKQLKIAGKNVFPNPSAYTAVTAIALGIPANCAVWVFISGRLDAWSKIFITHETS